MSFIKHASPVQSPVFIDFEASSLDLVSSYPIEVGICFPNGETQSWLIKPHILWKDWSEKAARIHGISRDKLQYKTAKVEPSFEMDSITSILTSQQIDRWQDVRESVINELKVVRHRAANDALILHKTWQAIGASL